MTPEALVRVGNVHFHDRSIEGVQSVLLEKSRKASGKEGVDSPDPVAIGRDCVDRRDGKSAELLQHKSGPEIMIGLPIAQARRRRPGKPIDVGDLLRRQSYAPPIRDGRIDAFAPSIQRMSC
jgi:hypothetical protein